MIPLQFTMTHQKGQNLQIQLPLEIESGEYDVVLVMQRKTELNIPTSNFISDQVSKIPPEDQCFLENELKTLSATGIDPFEDLLKI